MLQNSLLDWFYDQVLHYKEDMFRFAFSILHNVQDCEDAVGNAIIRAHDHIHALQKRESFRVWFAKIVRNEYYRILKEQKRNFPAEDDPSRSESGESFEAIDVRNALLKLPVERRTAITLYYLCGYSVPEIASVLKVPPGTVKSRLSRGRNELKKLLGGDEYEK